MPLAWWVRTTHDEMRRQDILLNKTREEMAKDYVTKAELEGDMERVFTILDKIEEKLDRLVEAR